MDIISKADNNPAVLEHELRYIVEHARAFNTSNSIRLDSEQVTNLPIKHHILSEDEIKHNIFSPLSPRKGNENHEPRSLQIS